MFITIVVIVKPFPFRDIPCSYDKNSNLSIYAIPHAFTVLHLLTIPATISKRLYKLLSKKKKRRKNLKRYCLPIVIVDATDEARYVSILVRANNKRLRWIFTQKEGHDAVTIVFCSVL